MHNHNTVRVISTTFLAIFLVGAYLALGRLQPSMAKKQQVTWPNLELVEVLGNLDLPVYITHAGDGSQRLFIVEQAGRIQVYASGQGMSTFLDIRDRVRSPASGGGGEEGLLSVAFPPNYASSRVFFVYYTNQDGDNQVSRFTTSIDPNQAEPNSETLVLLSPHPGQTNHNGGQLAFGPQDGFLYIGTGDGGGSGDPGENAQDLGTILGKLLRIDVFTTAASPPTYPNQIYLPMVASSNAQATAYQIPSDNPFLGQSGARPEIWAYGLRNPWRFSFDRQNYAIFIGDVGQGRVEEIDFQPAGSPGGENYGWDILEGSLCYEPSSGCQPPADYSPPIAEYMHGNNRETGCSVTGGYIYRGVTQPDLQGLYFYGDFCSGRIWGLQNDAGDWVSMELLDTNLFISTFGEDESGEIYVADRSSGTIYHLVASPAG